MVSTFDEFQAPMVEYPIDIMTMSETWLKNNPHLIDTSSTPGLKFLYQGMDIERKILLGVNL